MKKVFMMVALVLACTTGSLANETCTESATTSEMSCLPAKKSTKKKKATTKKKSTTTAKKTSSKSSTATATTATTATTDSSKTHSADTVNTKASAVGVLAELLGYAGGNSSNSTGSTTSKMGSIVGSILNNVIGSTTFKKADLCAHTWKYKSPGCAFTSENLLAKAGGEIAAKKVEEKLSTYYQKAGFSSSNTYFKFNPFRREDSRHRPERPSAAQPQWFRHQEHIWHQHSLRVEETAYHHPDADCPERQHHSRYYRRNLQKL